MLTKFFFWILCLIPKNNVSIIVQSPNKIDHLWNYIHQLLKCYGLDKKTYSLILKYSKNNHLDIFINTSYLMHFNSKQNELNEKITAYMFFEKPIKNFLVNSAKSNFTFNLIINDFRLHSENLKEFIL